MKKILSSLIIFLFTLTPVSAATVEMPYDSFTAIQKSYPGFGDKPWEKDYREYRLQVKQECKTVQIKLDEKLLAEKKKQEEQKRLEELSSTNLFPASDYITSRNPETFNKQPDTSNVTDNKTTTNEPVHFLSNTDKGSKAVNVALKHIGAKYVLGGYSWKNGLDCGGMISCAYRDVGIKITGNTHNYVNGNVGKTIMKAESKSGPMLKWNDFKDKIKPGDVLVYGEGSTWNKRGGGYYSHVQMYIGEGKVIHATHNPGVHVSKISNSRKYYRIQRIVN